jgi:predicted methyltransferase
MRRLALALLLATAAAPLPAIAKSHAEMAAPYAKAVAAKGRSADFLALDASRKPADVLAFMQLKPGMHTLDLLAGSGYYADLMARIVGPKGSVVAFSPATYMEGKSKAALEALAKRHKNLRYSGDMRALMSATNSVDFVMLHLNYHDFYFESVAYKIPRTDPNQVLAGLFNAVKPGGIVAVVDHVGPAGDTRAIVDKLHRIDPETVKADFLRAGFVLEAQSDILKVATDDHTTNVFDPAMRGKTDRFAFRFRKPV